MLKTQKKNRLRTNCPNLVGSTGGSVIDNLEGRLFSECGVDVDSSEYAESLVKVEDLKSSLRDLSPSADRLSSLRSFLVDNYFNRIKYDMQILPPSTETGDSLRASVLTVVCPPPGAPLPPNFGAESSYLADMQACYPSKGLTKIALAPTPEATVYATPSPAPRCLVAGKLCVLRGESPRYNSTGHVVAAKVISVSQSTSDPAATLVTLAYYHDPHPSRDDIKPASAKWAILDNSPPPPLVSSAFAVSRTPIYIKGKYTKLSRLTAQTPFFVPNLEGKGNVRKGLTSVEEEICSRLISSDVIKVCSHNDFRNREFGRIKFHASGREDMDVRMLSISGSGRPFVLEVTDSSKVPSEDELKKIENFICGGERWESREDYGDGGGGVGVRSLKLVGREDFGGLQKETEEKVKHYGCLCWSSKPHTSHELGAILDSTSSTTIIQSTPIRVLHRRAPMKRSREVLYRRTEWINNHFFRLWIATSAGAYVKEFVTGDFGRTNPSVSTMLDCQCDILQLDCVGIQMGT
ncbi:hypothetical protein TrCOL_g8278 [Triparma columacea]|uniref:tRNA pseudouridine(55) synthase n=1 Tax=Triparma columacea TaxID=722753 RepID=A0A9W7G6W8_9STRA|nr:hypothetical protein TrCOL_g8278 [Triparma columacea]